MLCIKFADSFFLPFCAYVLQLGLVIDLTNTSRYYPVSDLKKECIKHVKVCRSQILVTISRFTNFVFETVTPPSCPYI